MPRLSFLRTLAGAAVALTAALAVGSTAAHAQNARSWVASNGLDTAACSRANPCATFGVAITKTNPGGEITCVDAGNFGEVIINKSLTINCEGVLGSNASSLTATSNFIVNMFAAGDRAILRGLDIDRASALVDAITFNGLGTLVLDRVKISGAKGDGISGILFNPTGAGRLIVTDSIIANNGGPTTGAGIRVVPQAGASAQVLLERVNVSGNTFGIAADGTGSTGGINMTISDSVAASNTQDGIIAVTPGGGAPIGVLVTNSKSVNNAVGIRSIGPNVTVRVKNSDIAGNSTGLSFSGGGALLSFGNNAVQANGSNGAFSGTVPLQ